METDKLNEAKESFITQWGVLGTSWGINRTMAQIHALLMVSPKPLCTDEIMEDLQISRGNAHGNLRELAGWGIVKSVIIKGDRKEYFESEKDVWKMFCTITRERKRRELEPVVSALKACEAETKNLKGEDAENFNAQMKNLGEFTESITGLMDKVAKAESNKIMPWLLKNIK